MAYPTLNSNAIFSALYNQIISQQVFADNIAGTKSFLVDKARVDGTLYGDTKLYYSVDILKSADWLNDQEASNLLQLHRPQAPQTQAIILNKFRQIRLTIDNYLTKQAWKNEGAFADFNGVMLQYIRETKRVYDSTTYNAYIGTTTGAAAKSIINITTSTITETGEEKNRLEAQTIARGLANLMTELTDLSRDYNDYGYLRSYSPESIMIVWNSDFANKITNLDLPTIFHKDSLFNFENVLPSRYFGDVNTSQKTADSNTYSLIEQEIGSHHYFAGEKVTAGDVCPAGTSYQKNANIICKVMVKLPPFMSAFEVGTSFYNPRALTETNYLTWGHNTIQYLKNYPMISVKAN